MPNELTYEHGFNLTLQYEITDCAASSTTDGKLMGATARNGFVVPTGYKFHAIWIDVESNEARTAGTLTVKVTSDGTELATGPEAVLDATNTTAHAGVKWIGAQPIAAGKEVGVSATGDGSWAPATADVGVILGGVLTPA